MMRFLDLVIAGLALLAITACDFAPSGDTEDVSDLLDTFDLSPKNRERVELADRTIFARGQEHYIGLKTKKVMVAFDGTLSGKFKGTSLLGKSSYVLSSGYFPIGAYGYLDYGQYDGLTIYGVGNGFDQTAFAQERDHFLQSMDARFDHVSRVSFEDGSCALERFEKDYAILATFVRFELQEPVSGAVSRSTDFSENQELEVLRCVNAAHLFHVGLSNIFDPSLQQLLLIKRHESEGMRSDMTGMPHPELNWLTWFFSMFSHQTGVPREQFLVWLAQRLPDDR